MKFKMPSLKQLKEEFLLDNEQIKILLVLPTEEQHEFLTDRLIRVTIMKAMIESGMPEEEAKKVLTDPSLSDVIEVDEYGNERRKLWH